MPARSFVAPAAILAVPAAQAVLVDGALDWRSAGQPFAAGPHWPPRPFRDR